MTASEQASVRRHVVVVTGGRADFGVLLEPMRRLAAEPSLRISTIVTGMHLDPNFGDTLGEIERSGFTVAGRVPVLEAEDSAAGVARAIGRGVIGFVESFSTLSPDLVLLLGDRYEIFAAAQAAFMLRIPIAHLCGGDVTNGALDDGLRHCITKLSSLHFTTNEDASRRVRQLGEMQERVFCVGSPGLDLLLKMKKLAPTEIEARLGSTIPTPYLLATFHPATLDAVPAAQQADIFLSALSDVVSRAGVVFTLSNADEGGRKINDRINRFVETHSNARAFSALGSELYHNLMMNASAVIGNSSSGLYEAPSFGVPTVNIGRRQDGRLRAASVIDCPLDERAIKVAIERAMLMNRVDCTNPYGDGRASERIANILVAHSDWPSLVYKIFSDWREPDI